MPFVISLKIKHLKRITFISIYFVIVFLFVACNYDTNKLGCCDPMSLNYDPEATIDNGECIYSDALFYMNPDSISQPDADGNLIVINESKQPLHLYVDGVRSKLIPAYAGNYLVNIPRKADKCELSIYKVAEIGDISNPDYDCIFKKWVVVLPTDNEPENRIKWVISDFATSEGNGSIRFTYPSQQGGFEYSYNTDVYLQSKTGAYMVSLKPGSGYSMKIDYGVYKFYYKFWYSKSDDVNSVTQIGWLESPYHTLNAAHDIIDINIPGFNAIPSDVASLKVTNKNLEAVNVYWGQTLIEDMVFGYENTEGLSALSPQHETLYYLQPGENSIVTKDFSGVKLEEIKQVTLVGNWQAEVFLGQDKNEVYCSNKTDQIMYLGTDSYIGIALQPKEERFIGLPEGIEWTVFNRDSTFIKSVSIQANNLVIE